jgi:hypothetical protein
MKFTVIYRLSAENQLAELWNGAPDRGAITRAADEIDRRLAKDPHREGESRTETTRILFVRPLAVLFEISDADRMVHVLRFWPVPSDV